MELLNNNQSITEEKKPIKVFTSDVKQINNYSDWYIGIDFQFINDFEVCIDYWENTFY